MVLGESLCRCTEDSKRKEKPEDKWNSWSLVTKEHEFYNLRFF